MGRKLFIAEKPKVAKALGQHLNAQMINSKEGLYHINSDVVIVPCFGHLLELYDAADYDEKYKSWKLDNYPFVPNEFKYKVVNDEAVKKQFALIKEYANASDVDAIINCCDFDREGELIFYTNYMASGSQKPVYRMYINDMTFQEIRNSLKNLKPQTDFVGLQNAGLSRQWMDWLIGINMTTAATLKLSDHRMTLNIGRVILPTLNFIYERDIAIDNFKAEPFFEIEGLFSFGDVSITGKHIVDDKVKRFDPDDKTAAEKVVDVAKKDKVEILEFIKSESTSSPSKLFSQTSLQRHILKSFNLFKSGDQILKTVQSLYESGYVTYPRTSSEHLKETEISKAEGILQALCGNMGIIDATFHSSKSVFDDSKVGSHTALIPTKSIPKIEELDEKSKLVYQEIRNRFVSQFLPKAKFEKIDILYDCGGYLFRTSGKILIDAGFNRLDTEFAYENFPSVQETDFKGVENARALELETSPPKRMTEDQLLSLMLSCGKDIEEADINDVLAGFEIGTEATRAATIKKIIDVGYVKRKGKSLITTPTGRNLIEMFPTRQLINPRFTGTIGMKLVEIEKGKLTKESFMDGVKSMVMKTVEDIKAMPEGEKILDLSDQVIGECYICGHDVVDLEREAKCLNPDCNFSIYKKSKYFDSFKNLNLNKSLIKDILSGQGSTNCLNIITKNDKRIDALLSYSWSESNERYEWSLDMGGLEMASLGSCPRCSGEVKENGRGYACGCGFIIFKNNNFFKGKHREGKKPKSLSAAHVKKLLKGEAIKIKGLYSTKYDKDYDAELILIDNGQYANLEFKAR